MERGTGGFVQFAAAAGDRGVGGGPGDRLSTRLPGAASPPARDVARLEDVLTEKAVDPELAACLRADAAGEPEGATNLGVLLEQRGDVEGALAAYRRADRRGDVNGTFNLGCLLAEQGDLEGARAALERADERGDAAAASNLGVLLEREGELEDALAAYRRGDERGDGAAALNLGLLLAARGDLEGARAAYRRAAERDDPEVRERVAEAEAEIAPVEVEIPGRESSRTPWIVALCILALVALFVLRRRPRR
jgi:tetratricopeptide (TPR) repeat protein